jgi:hypothetical protein
VPRATRGQAIIPNGSLARAGSVVSDNYFGR